MIIFKTEHALGLMVLLILLGSVVGSYIRKLIRENETKDQAIAGLREIIKLMQERK